MDRKVFKLLVDRKLFEMKKSYTDIGRSCDRERSAIGAFLNGRTDSPRIAQAICDFCDLPVEYGLAASGLKLPSGVSVPSTVVYCK